MLWYEIEDGLVIVRIAGQSTTRERYALFARIRHDSRVPAGAMVLIDALAADIDLFTEADALHRIKRTLHQLAPKAGSVCAVVMRAVDPLEAHFFRRPGDRADLRIGIFRDEPSARAWLKAFAVPDGVRAGVRSKRRIS